MEVLDFFVNLGKAAEQIKQPMTLEEAIDIIDPDKRIECPGDENVAKVKELKARYIVTEYVRSKMAEDNDG